MKSLLLLTFHIVLLYGCFYASGQPQNTFTVHAEIMGDETHKPATAANVAVNSQSVTACFDDCNTQVTMLYAGLVMIEREGKEPVKYPAQVFQLEPGVWLADIEGGQWVKIFAHTGSAQMDIDGQFIALQE